MPSVRPHTTANTSGKENTAALDSASSASLKASGGGMKPVGFGKDPRREGEWNDEHEHQEEGTRVGSYRGRHRIPCEKGDVEPDQLG